MDTESSARVSLLEPSSISPAQALTAPNQQDECNHYPLEEFFKGLKLEQMTYGRKVPDLPTGRSTMMPLKMGPGGYRILRDITRVPRLETETSYFFNESEATLGLEKELESLELTVQLRAEQLQLMMGFNPYHIEERSAIIFTIERCPIRSAEKLAAVFNKELVNWRFFTPARSTSLSKQKLEPKYYCTLDENGNMEDVRCVLISLTTWEFSATDFHEFSNKTHFVDGHASMNGQNLSPPWVNADVMWAYVYDLCLNHECHHFVITSYEDWVFGSFTDYYTVGYVSPVILCGAQPKSPLEYLTYWILSSCRSIDTAMVEQDRPKSSTIRRLFAKPTVLAKREAETTSTDPSLIEPAAKRLRRDPFEVRMGWEPLEGHRSQKFTKILRRVNPQPAKRPPPADDAFYDFPAARPEWNKFMSKRKHTSVKIPHIDRKGKGKKQRTPDENDLPPTRLRVILENEVSSSPHAEGFEFPSLPSFSFKVDLLKSRYDSEVPGQVERLMLSSPAFGATSSGLGFSDFLGPQYIPLPSEGLYEREPPMITRMICQSFDPPLEEEVLSTESSSDTMEVDTSSDAQQSERTLELSHQGAE